MRQRGAILFLGAAGALLAGACGSGKGRSDGGMPAVAIGLTPCRDLAPVAGAIVAAASSPHFLVTNPLGSSEGTK